MTWTVFQGGDLKYQEEAKKAALEEARAQYEQVVLSALKEVEECLLEVSSWQKALSSLGAFKKGAEALRGISYARLKAGLVDRLAVLDAEAELERLRLQELEARLEYLKAVVKLYKDLGGGWWDEG